MGPLSVFPFSGRGTDRINAGPEWPESPRLLLQPPHVSLIISLKNENLAHDGNGSRIQ